MCLYEKSKIFNRRAFNHFWSTLVLGDLNVITFKVDQYVGSELWIPILILMMSYLDSGKNKV